MGIIFRQSAKGSIITLLGAGIGFVSTFFIATYFLSPSQIGLTRLLVEAATLVGGFALLATHSSSIRYYPHFSTPDGKDKGFIWWLLGIPILGILIFGGIYLLYRGALIHYFSQSGSEEERQLFGNYYLMVLPLMVFVMYPTLMEVYCSLKQRVALPKAIREVVLRLLLIGAYLLYGLTSISFNTFIYLYVGAYGICMVMILLYAHFLNPAAIKGRISTVPRPIRKDFAQYTLFTVSSALGGAIASRLDLFMVSSQMGLLYGGIYTIAFFIIAIIEMPSRSLMSISSPLASAALFREDYEEVNRLYRKVSQLQVLVGVILFTLIWTNIDTIFALIPKSEIYAQGKWVVLVLGIARIIDLSFNFGNAILRYSKHYPWTLAYTIIVTILTILLNLILIERLGMVGAAVGTLCTYIISYIFQQMILWNKLRITPMSLELAKILLTFTLVTVAELLLPKSGILWWDSLWRTVIVMGLLWMLIHKKSSYQELVHEVQQSLNLKR